jgi:hypothetical protein
LADNIVIAVNRLDQGDVEELASHFLAVPALRKPAVALTSDEQLALGRPLRRQQPA